MLRDVAELASLDALAGLAHIAARHPIPGPVLFPSTALLAAPTVSRPHDDSHLLALPDSLTLAHVRTDGARWRNYPLAAPCQVALPWP